MKKITLILLLSTFLASCSNQRYGSIGKIKQNVKFEVKSKTHHIKMDENQATIQNSEENLSSTKDVTNTNEYLSHKIITNSVSEENNNSALRTKLVTKQNINSKKSIVNIPHNKTVKKLYKKIEKTQQKQAERSWAFYILIGILFLLLGALLYFIIPILGFLVWLAGAIAIVYGLLVLIGIS